ncbi:MAG: hypothetical protein ABJ004_04235 [Cyclobacteriaceae bacterium]
MKKVFYFLICALAIATGCNFDELDFNNLEGPTITSNSAIPLGHVSYTIRELIDRAGDTDVDLQEDSTTLIYLSYQDTVSFSQGSDILDISQVEVPAYEVTISAIPATPTEQIIPIIVSDTIEFVYEPSEKERVDSIFYSTGTLSLNIAMSPDQGITSTYTATLIDTKEVSSGNMMMFDESGSPDQSLVGYKTNFNVLTDASGIDTANIFKMVLDYTITIPANTDFQESTVRMAIDYSDDTDFELIYGRFGQDTVSFQGEPLDIDFFDDLGESGLYFGNPEITFNYSSNLGVPLGILYNEIYGVEGTQNPDTIYLSGEITETPQELNIPTTPGDFATTESAINTDNSTIRPLLSATPNQLAFGVSAVSNPFDADQSNFLVPNSEITATVEAILPLELKLEDVTRDIDFSLGGGLDFNETDSLTLRIVSVNEIPFSVWLTIEIYDENDSLSYVAAEHLTIQTPFLNLDGSLKQPRKHIEDIPINEEGITALNNGKRINLRVALNTPESLNSNDIYVKVLADYKLDIQISAVGTLKVDL